MTSPADLTQRAREFLQHRSGGLVWHEYDVAPLASEFARIHREALTRAAEIARATTEELVKTGSDETPEQKIWCSAARVNGSGIAAAIESERDRLSGAGREGKAPR